jgi:hypothetical protein
MSLYVIVSCCSSAATALEVTVRLREMTRLSRLPVSRM